MKKPPPERGVRLKWLGMISVVPLLRRFVQKPEISLAELYVGAYKSKSGRMESILEYMERTFSVAPVSPALKEYASIRAELESKGTRLEDLDLMIAATALEKGYTLVSHNIRHYARIPGLKLEDWMQEA